MSRVTLGFIPTPISVPIEDVLLSKPIKANVSTSRKFLQILASIKEVGVIEPLSVTQVDGQSGGKYVLLDGHLRILALQQLGIPDVLCLVATDDESYTYNNRLNRISSIQEHRMICRAIEQGVSPEQLARALAVDISFVRRKASLLDGLCPEVIELLKDRQFSCELARALRKMKPTRQMECVELMSSVNNLTVAYAEALLVATPANQLVSGRKPSRIGGVSAEQMSMMEREMGNLQVQYKLVEQTYGQDVLNLVIAKGFLSKLMENAAVHRFIAKYQPDLISEFEAIIATITLDQPHTGGRSQISSR
nr:plasmid partitioning protein RepB C-terminal domain-containing protein [Pandoraea sp. PE-S2R-1]